MIITKSEAKMSVFTVQEAELGLPTSCRLPVAGSLMFQDCLVLIIPIYLFWN